VVLPTGDATLLVVITYGYFENMKRYREVIERWNTRGLAVVTYDLRGHGLSEGRRGFIARFTDYTDDLTALLDELGKDTTLRQLGRPMLFGHSLGGLISIHGALRAQPSLSGLALSSPWLANAKKVPAVKLIPGRLLSRLVPTISMPAGVKGADCTRSPEIAEAYENDPMNFKTANVRWFTESARAQSEAQERASEIKLPLICIHGAADKIAQPAASEHFVTRTASADKEYVSLPGNYHEVLNEPDRATTIDRFATAMLRWKDAIPSGTEG
jgi:alpha-beta hydrolase superfamily lysophospholipase